MSDFAPCQCSACRRKRFGPAEREVFEFLWLAALLLGLGFAFSASAGAPVYHRHTITLASADCPTGSPGLAADGVAWGISLAALRGFEVTICPEDGETITGAGSVKVCSYSTSTWGPGQWALSPELTWTLDSSYATTSGHPCLKLGQLETVIGLSDRVFVYPSPDFGVSGGTTVTVYLVGEQR